MSRRHLTFVVVAIASLVVSACNSSSVTGLRPTTSAHDDIPMCDPTRIGTAGSSGRC
jgi:hypothetical protein